MTIVLAYLSLHTGEIKQIIYDDYKPLAAMNDFLDTNFDTEEDVYQYCSDTDSYISYIEI